MAAVWAWEDESAGRVRARVFPIGIGIEEDEATGAAALMLAAKVGRAVEIHQGQGSVIHARPGPDGSAEIGGRAVLDDVREL
jgi:predicted PhzF superfamily epimerase YddE/YHI9